MSGAGIGDATVVEYLIFLSSITLLQCQGKSAKVLGNHQRIGEEQLVGKVSTNVAIF